MALRGKSLMTPEVTLPVVWEKHAHAKPPHLPKTKKKKKPSMTQNTRVYIHLMGDYRAHLFGLTDSKDVNYHL